MKSPTQSPTPSDSAFFPNGLPTRKRSPRKETVVPVRPQPGTSEVDRDLEIAATGDFNVLVIGETGTGKEVVARRLHQLRRARLGLSEADAPWVAVNCAALPENLVESILFGHERGAFTSARERQYGKFESARRGTLFLDEIQVLPTSTQAKLLRALQSREVDVLGSRSAKAFHCQVIAATNMPLELLVRQKKFRRDLYYRLNICPIYLPALRQRLVELPSLIKDKLAELRAQHGVSVREVSPDAFEMFLAHNWPGNIRELEHVLLFAALRCGECIELEHLPSTLTGRLENYLRDGLWEE